jgi:hypothetical protein
MSASKLLMGFLAYYGSQFNPMSQGVSVYNEGYVLNFRELIFRSFYPLSGMYEQNQMEILDPLNQQNNTTRNSYHTKEILQSFKFAFNTLNSLIYTQSQLTQRAAFNSEQQPKASQRKSSKPEMGNHPEAKLGSLDSNHYKTLKKDPKSDKE